jgi:hypothetical protein
MSNLKIPMCSNKNFFCDVSAYQKSIFFDCTTSSHDMTTIHVMIVFNDKVDVNRLRYAWQQVYDNCAFLRLSFQYENYIKINQIINDPIEIKINLNYDLLNNHLQ